MALTQRGGRLVVEVSDDGVGGADLGRGTGLRGLAERVAAIDGRLEIDSRSGQGTIVRAGLARAPGWGGASLSRGARVR